ncbi:BREX-2 system phosphatase PglZ [Micrococcus terreus]|uniref:PglZ domain-containing protein n=1 Tax=Micrococcus terreus TaxID=574650 RepID=A0A1I7MIW8_9MICC|nr:BREX-2 system phosphatase PglZ [Micrococcus terreus]SFV21878.1 PglZ domain-containing protein [Micrococcus terreus]
MQERSLSRVLRGTVLAAVDAARRVRGEGRVLGLRALESPDLPETLHNQHGEVITVRWCPSALAVWDAIHRWDGTRWLVVLTDQDEERLGSGTMALFVEHRLRTPDPWDTVKQRFGAATLHRDLSGRGSDDLAQGLIRAEPVLTAEDPGGWPKVRSGVLTRDAVLGAVAERRLGLPDTTPDAPAVLEWTAAASTVTLVGDLRHLAGHPLADATLHWLAGRTGEAEPVTRYLMTEGRFQDILPLGLAADHLDLRNPTEPESELAWARLEHRYGPGEVSRSAVAALGQLADETIRAMLQRGRSTQRRVLDILQRAEGLLREAHAEHLVNRSRLLPGGLRARHRHLADQLGNDLAAVEETWLDIDTHVLTNLVASEEDGKTYEVLQAAVRLDRWLRTGPTPLEGDRQAQAVAMSLEFAQDTAWADACLTTILRGVPDAHVAGRLRGLAESFLERRRVQDRAFAAVLEPIARGQDLPGPAHPGTIRYLEHVLEQDLLPLARTVAQESSPQPGGLLILLLDGMDGATATQVVAGIQGIHRTWTELVPAGTAHRATALALLPTLTTHSRTSFFAGRAMSGGQDAERAGFAAAAERAGLPAPVLFHKGDLEARAHGQDLAEPVRAALMDTSARPVVACVLNTIDDALDRSDPGGTDWSADSIKYLRSLLEAAAASGRTVVLTADHGHVLERGGTLRSTPSATSARSRTLEGGPALADEVTVTGSRVLGGDTVLAVDADLRYTGKKAGYHGGASLAEMVVPLIVLSPHVSGSGTGAWPAGWEEAPSQEPLWWSAAVADGGAVPEPRTAGRYASAGGDEPPSLFDDLEPAAPAAGDSGAATGLGSRVVASQSFASQEALAPRHRLESARIAELIDVLAAARGTRLPLSTVSRVLGVAPTRLPGALAVISQLLNVEGYSVLTRDGDLVILDVQLLKQQFGVDG